MSYDPFNPNPQQDDPTVVNPYDPFMAYKREREEDKEKEKESDDNNSQPLF